jgi:hypothetical protein
VGSADFDALDHRLATVERDVAELREALTEERIATGKLAAQVSAHEVRGQERHSEVMTALGALRQELHLTLQATNEREAARTQFYGRALLGLVSIAGTVAAGYFGLAR